MNTCFICTESYVPLHVVCSCATHVHEECMNKVLNTVRSHAKKCPICLTDYNIGKRPVRMKQIGNTLIIIMMHSFLLLLSGFFVLFYFTVSPHTTTPILEILLYLIIVLCFGCMISLHVLHYTTFGTCCPWYGKHLEEKCIQL